MAVVYYSRNAKPVLMPVVRTYDWTSLVSFQGIGTPTISFVKCHRVGKQAIVSGRITTGTPTAAQARINLPSGVSIDGVSGSVSSGTFDINQTTINKYKDGIIISNSSTPNYLMFGYGEYALAGSRFVERNGDQIFDAVQVFTFQFQITVAGWDEYEAIGTGVATADRAGLVPALSNLVPMQSRVAVTFGITSPTTLAASCAHFYQLPSGQWMMWFSFAFSWGSQSPTSIAIGLTGVPLPTDVQTFSGMFLGAATPTEAYADVNGLYLSSSGGASTGAVFQGTIRLASKPTI